MKNIHALVLFNPQAAMNQIANHVRVRSELRDFKFEKEIKGLLFEDFLLSFKKIIVAHGHILTSYDVVTGEKSHAGVTQEIVSESPYEVILNDVRMMWTHDEEGF